MADKPKTNGPGELPGQSSPSGPENFNVSEFKELLDIAAHERKNLQMLVEYFEHKTVELEEKKHFFEKIEAQVPYTLNKLDTFNQSFQEIKTIDVRVRDFQRVSKELESNYNTLKRELDELHLLSEHIDHKIKSLHQQRGLVEKANDDAGRLNVLIWDMDSKVKKLKEENKLIKSADRSINRLEGMMDLVSDKVDEIVSFKEMMNTGSIKVEEMKTTLEEIDSRLTIIHQEKESIVNYTRDTEDLKRTLDVVKEDYETVLGKSHLVRETHDLLNRLNQEVSDLKVESKNISVKNEMIRSISGRLRDLDALSVDVETKISRILDEKVVVEKTEEKINKLNIFLMDNLGNKMAVLKEEMKIIDAANEKMSQFNMAAGEAEEKVKRLDKEIEKIDSIASIMQKIEEISESTRLQMDEVIRKQNLVDQVDKKINDLGSMVIRQISKLLR